MPDTNALKSSAPYSRDAEFNLLGGLIQRNDAWLDVSGIIATEDLYLPSHRVIHANIKKLADSGQPFDAVLLKAQLERTGELERAGGIEYMERLMFEATGAPNVVAYAHIVVDHSVRRQLIAASKEIANASYQGEADTADLLNLAQKHIYSIQQGRQRGKGLSHVAPIIEHLSQRVLGNAPTEGVVSTGYEELDFLTEGFWPGQLVILAGRPGSGKTTLALNFAEKCIMRNTEGACLVFSLEMSDDELLIKILSSLAKINSKKLRKGSLSPHETESFLHAVNRLKSKSLHIEDTAALTSSEIRNSARRFAIKEKIALIIVDYLQLMRSDGKREQQRVNEVAEFSGAMKALAKELNVPVIALSQLNRSAESRNDKRPRMSDLRDSGAIEQDADLILFVHHDESETDSAIEDASTKIIIGKHRTGATGETELRFRKEISQFVSLERINPNTLDADDAEEEPFR